MVLALAEFGLVDLHNDAWASNLGAFHCQSNVSDHNLAQKVTPVGHRVGVDVDHASDGSVGDVEEPKVNQHDEGAHGELGELKKGACFGTLGPLLAMGMLRLGVAASHEEILGSRGGSFAPWSCLASTELTLVRELDQTTAANKIGCRSFVGRNARNELDWGILIWIFKRGQFLGFLQLLGLQQGDNVQDIKAIVATRDH